MRGIRRKFTFGFAFFVLSAMWAIGQDFRLSALTVPPDYDQVLAQQSPDLKVALTLPKNHFYQGEIIEATLTYTNTGKDPHTVWLARGDRSGRIQEIRFFGQDEHGMAVEDPIGWIYLQGVMMGGGRGDFKDLGTASITLPINQWLRFDHPGTYTIFADTTNVRSGSAQMSYQKSGQLISNKMIVTITPLASDEEKRIIDEAVQKIDAGYHREDSPGMSAEQNDEKARMKAYTVEPDIAILRYLQTPAARAALRARLDKTPEYMLAGGHFEMTAALLGAPDRPAEAAFILADVRAGKLQIDNGLTSLYADLKSYPQAMANYAWNKRTVTVDEIPLRMAAEKEWEKAKNDAQNEILAAAEEASSKTGLTDINLIWTAFLTNPFDPAYRAPAVAHQLEFSPDQQHRLLSMMQMDSGRPRLPTEKGDDPADFLPLVHLYVGAPSYNRDALTILAKVRPEEARPLIIQDLSNPEHHYMKNEDGMLTNSASWPLLALPAGPIPEMEKPLRALLKEENYQFVAIELIGRYGTPALLPDLIEVYRKKSGLWDGDTQKAALSFWVRNDSKTGLVEVQRALADRRSSTNYRYVLQNVFDETWVPEAQPILLKALEDPDQDVAMHTMYPLLEHGNAACAVPMLAAFDRLPPLAKPQWARNFLNAKGWKWSDEQRQSLEKIFRAQIE